MGMSARLKWGAEVPKVSGWYWWRDPSSGFEGIHHFHEEAGGTFCTTNEYGDEAGEMGGEWAGPIEVPE